jgi:lipoprotein-releasing system permease protein
MFSKLEFFIALRYLKAKRKEKFISITAFFSLIGIMLGVATLIIVMSVMNGFRADLIERILGINAHITVYSNDGRLYNYKELIKQVSEISNVEKVNAIVENAVMVTANGASIGGLVKGIEQKDLKNKKEIYNNIISKNFNDFSKNDSVLLGFDLARQLSVKEGDSVKIISPEANNTILGSIPRMKTYKVIGTFKSGMYEYDNAAVFMPIKSAQLHFRYNDSVSALEINVNNLEEVGKTSRDILRTLEKIGQEVSIIDWKQANSAFMGALKVERNVMFIILTLIILVAAFNIISSLIMLVNDKNKQIALLRTIGATKGNIMSIFFICGSAIGLMGTALGAILGIIFTLNIENIRQFIERNFSIPLFNPTIYFLSQLPSKLFISDLIFIISMSLILSFLATLYPAYKASKTNPADVLRYE